MILPTFRASLIALSLLFPAAGVFGQAASPDPQNGIVTMEDFVFGKGGEQDLHADIAYPKKASGPCPAIIIIHGGGWNRGTYKDKPVVQLAQGGYFAASIEYRLDDVARWPAQIEDCKLAVRWLRANAAKFNVDPNRIGAWGDSAGGHLVMCLATMAHEKKFEGHGAYPGVSSAIQAGVEFYGPCDFTQADQFAYGPLQLVVGLFGVPWDKDPALWKSGSPLFYVAKGDPPMLLVHGDSDSVVPVSQAMAFDTALAKAGVPHQLVVVKNAEHMWRSASDAPLDPDLPTIYRMTLDFFGKHLATAPAQ